VMLVAEYFHGRFNSSGKTRALVLERFDYCV